MPASITMDRKAFIAKAEADAKRWSGYVDRLLRAFHESDRESVAISNKVEALRNKRDSFVTKVVALKRHGKSGWSAARHELEEARRELRDCWRSVILTLERESALV